jgi:hypothetical protein
MYIPYTTLYLCFGLIAPTTFDQHLELPTLYNIHQHPIQLIIIEKDLKRLPHPAEEKRPSFVATNTTTTVAGSAGAAISSPSNYNNTNNNTPEHEARITSLREILYIYAQEHPDIGYRQGMHEIASYLLFLLELEHEQYPDHDLFHPILPICYALLEQTLHQLKTAYDVNTGGKSLQQMSIAILGKVLQNNPTLYHHLTSNPHHIPPPPIYCTRWVRLMFSREVVGYHNVFKLWDVFYSYANVMQALEMACASRILLLGGDLLQPDQNTLDLLMNVPPLNNIDPFTNVLQKLMDQKEGDHAVALPNDAVPPNIIFQQQHHQQQHMLHPLLFSASPMPRHSTTLSSSGGAMVATMDQQQHHHHQVSSSTSSYSNDSNKFSFSKMRQSLGQKVDSIGHKIAIKTMEWSEATRRETNPTTTTGGTFAAVFGSATTFSHSFDPLGGLETHPYMSHSHNASSSSHHHHPPLPPPNTTGPFLSSMAAAFHGSMSNLTLQSQQQQQQQRHHEAIKSPQQYQHEMWSQMLQQKIMTVQEFLMELESKENQGTVPPEVWEALADMDRMQRELFHYSRNMAAAAATTVATAPSGSTL